MKRRYENIIMAVLLLVVAGAADWAAYHNRPRTQTAAAPKPAATSAKAAASPSPAPFNPLQIPALQQRAYTAGPLATEQELGEQGGYRNAVASYQSDGFKVYALVSTPDGARPAAGWPVIILAHGYIDPAAYQTTGPEYRSFIAAFAQAGYMVVKPDYRGHGHSQGQPEGGHFSPVYAYDLLNLVAALKHSPAADPARLGLFAHSLGGHEALRTIVVSKDIKATVFMAGVVGSFYDLFYNWPNSPMSSDQPATLVQGARQALITQYGDPKSNPAFWDSASAVNYVGAITGAVQINQDTGDSVVPRLFADHLAAALTSAHKDVQYYTYPGDDHQFTQNRTLLLQHAVAFYKAHL